MKTSKTILLSMFMASVALISCGKDDVAVKDITKESNSIKELVTKTYRDALASSKADNVLAAFTTDAVVMGNELPTAIGADGLKDSYSATFDAVGLNLNFTIDQIIVGENYGFVRSVSTGDATVNSSEQSATEQNRELFIVKKEGGSWKIARYIYNKQDTYKASTQTSVVNGASGTSSTTEINAVKSVVTSSYQTALNASNANAMTDVYAANAVVMGPGSATVEGNANIKAMYAGLFSTLGLNLVFTIDEAVIDGEYAYVRSHSNGNVIIGDTNIPASYREIFVLQKVNGNWKIVWYLYNQPTAA